VRVRPLRRPCASGKPAQRPRPHKTSTLGGCSSLPIIGRPLSASSSFVLGLLRRSVVDSCGPGNSPESERSLARSCPTRVQHQASRPPVKPLDHFAGPQLVYLLLPLPSANDAVWHEPQPHVIYQTSINIHTVTIRTIVNVYPIESDDRVSSDLHGMAAAMWASSPPPPIMARPRVRELSL